MPDEALFTAAKSGSLDKPEQVAVQAARMLKDDRARDGIRDFHMQWLGLYGVDEIEKGDIYKTYSPEVAQRDDGRDRGLPRRHPLRPAGHRQARGDAHLQHAPT